MPRVVGSPVPVCACRNGTISGDTVLVKGEVYELCAQSLARDAKVLEITAETLSLALSVSDLFDIVMAGYAEDHATVVVQFVCKDNVEQRIFDIAATLTSISKLQSERVIIGDISVYCIVKNIVQCPVCAAPSGSKSLLSLVTKKVRRAYDYVVNGVRSGDPKVMGGVLVGVGVVDAIAGDGEKHDNGKQDTASG